MNPNISNNANRQSVSQALNLIHDAQIHDKSLNVKKNGDIEVIYDKTAKPNQPLSNKIVTAILKKIGDESQPILDKLQKNKDDYIFELQEKIPGLEQFILLGKFQNLHKSWDSWEKIKNVPSTSDYIKKNQKLISELEKLIPTKLKIRPDRNHIATMTHRYSKEQQKIILQDFKNLNEAKLDSETGLSTQFLLDAGRNNYIFISNGNEISIDLGNKQKVVDTLIDTCGGDKVMAGAISKLLCQTAVAPLVFAEQNYVLWGEQGSPAIFLGDAVEERRDKRSEYKILIQNNGDILYSFMSVRKSSLIENPHTGKRYKINSSDSFAGEPSAKNFTIRTLLSLSMKKEDLKNNIIDPKIIDEPEITYRLEVSES